MSKKGKVSCNKKMSRDNQANHDHVSDGQVASDYQIPNSSEMSHDDRLSYDWETSETLQRVKAFPVSDYGTKSDETLSDFMVPEPPSISGIDDSLTNKTSSSKTTTDVEENYIVDDMSSLSSISAIKVSKASRKHMFAKERVEREGNAYDKLYNACLKGQISIIKDILKTHNAPLMPDENGQTPLYAACIGNHPEVVKLLIDNKYDVNHQDNEGKTPLHVAFENHAPDIAKSLIDQFKANLEVRDSQNWTPLHTAIDRGYSNYSELLLLKCLLQDVDTEVSLIGFNMFHSLMTRIRHGFQRSKSPLSASWILLHAACFEENAPNVQFLLDADADVNHASSAGHTPLHIAVAKRNIDIVTLLLNKNVIVNSVTIDGKTPLHIAVDKGEEVIIKKLLAQKANPTLKDAFGNTSLHLAVQWKEEIRQQLFRGRTTVDSDDGGPSLGSYQPCSVQTVQAIIDHGADLNAVNNTGQTALWSACCDGQVHFVKILLNAGADPNIADENNDSSLHSAMYGLCSSETVQKIIEHGARINVQNKNGATPLLLACSGAQPEVLKLLLKRKADPNIADENGDTSLHAAIVSGCNSETLQEIIYVDVNAMKKRTNVNATNRRGRTALLLSCSYRQTDSVNVLLRAGANPTVADDEGFSCLHAAVDGRCSKDTLQALIGHGAYIDAKRKDGTNALLRACGTGQSESVIFLLKAGADAKIAKTDGTTSLQVAVNGHCSKETLQALIQHGVDVNAVNNNGQTALLSACYTSQDASVKLLLTNGADPNVRDAKGCTSLHAAVHGRCTHEIIQEITRKSFVNATNIDNQTALLLACSFRQYDSVKTLLEAEFDPNIADNDGDTSIHAAVHGGCGKKIIQALIDKGANVNATNKMRNIEQH